MAFFANAAGMKEKPVVIYKTASPCCFKRIDRKNLPVSYYHQEKAWMSDLDDYSVPDSDEVELTQLIEQVCKDPPDLDMSLNFVQDIVCREFDDENWNNEFFLELDRTQGSSSRPRTEDASSDNKEDEADDEPFQPTIKTLTEAIDLLEQTQYFLDFSGYESVANEVGAVIDKVVLLQMKELMSAKQSHIDEYFH